MKQFYEAIVEFFDGSKKGIRSADIETAKRFELNQRGYNGAEVIVSPLGENGLKSKTTKITNNTTNTNDDN